MRRWVATAVAAVVVGTLLGIGIVSLLLRGVGTQAPTDLGPPSPVAEADAPDQPGGGASLEDPGPGAGDAGAGTGNPGVPAADPPTAPDPADAADSDGGEPEPAPPPPVPANLRAHLEALLAREHIQAVDNLSVLVVDEHGQVVAGHAADRAVTPASTTKMVTAAAALRLLGPDYQFVTRVHATGDMAERVLDGDLVIVGSGDPALASPVFMRDLYPARPHTDLDALAAAVEATGVRVVRGSVVGDPRLFADEPVPSGWPDRYFYSLDAAYVSALTVDSGRRLFERDEVLLAEAAAEPPVLAAEVLTALLAERGIVVVGEPGIAQLPSGAAEVGRVRSPPLRVLLRHVVQMSDNPMADGVFRTLGAVAGASTWAGSATAAQEALGDAGIDWSGAVLADGSGLSRDVRLSARMLVELDREMMRTQPDEWRPLLAVAGQSGTLRNRLRGTPAEGRLAGKTGALQDARALAGHVDADDRRYHFAVLGSELGGAGIQAVRMLTDEVAVLLAGGPPPCAPEALDEDGACPG